MGQARHRMAWRLGILVAGAAVVVALGLSLLAGESYADRFEHTAALKLLTPMDASAFAACPPAAPRQTETGFTVSKHAGVTTYTSDGQAQSLSSRQILSKAECLRRRGLITAQTLAAVTSEAAATHAGNRVPWWAPAAVVPNWATVLLWSLLLFAELLGVAALVSPSRRRRPPVDSA
jgi:hypothetical protein